MGLTLTEKIIQRHLVSGNLQHGKEISLKIDQTLTQDATGTMAYLQFQALGIDKVATKLSVSYVDHNTLQESFENADDHLFLQSIAAKHGILFSKAGNGICHQVHLERFTKPGETLLGSDSHTPTAGGMGMLAMGAGGLDVAVAMGGSPLFLTMPKILGIKLTGQLQKWVAAKDIILELLRRLGVKGGVGKILEYYGEGIKKLNVPERATITNMGAELGATSSLFPSDEITRSFLQMQNRENDWKELQADEDANYDEVIEINLDYLEPMIARPHSPGNVCKVKEVEGLPINQVCIGSCTNSSYKDLMIIAKVLEGKKVHPNVSLVVSPGSKQVYETLARDGALAHIIESGARVLECVCGPCIGMGQAPPSNGISLRTFNRNFAGRSGTKSAQVYLVSPETAIASAIFGKITDPRKFGVEYFPEIELPQKMIIKDSLLVKPAEDSANVEIIMGPNIKSLPLNIPLSESLVGEVLLHVGDNITTDQIMPAGAKILPLRSNIPAISEYVFETVDPDFVKRAKENEGGFIVGGENYGQGSSREHAALAPMYLGIKIVIAKSFARIHRTNLINFGILPLEFFDPNDYNKINQGDVLEVKNIKESLSTCNDYLQIYNKSKDINIKVKPNLNDRQIKIILSGGLLNFIKNQYNNPNPTNGESLDKLKDKLNKEEVKSMNFQNITLPNEGEKIEFLNGKLNIPHRPIIGLIKGDGIGLDISQTGQNVIDAAVSLAYNHQRKIVWLNLLAGEAAFEKYGDSLPKDTLNAINHFLVAIEGPLTTPIGKGEKSLNVRLRQELNLYSCVRPVKYFEGVPSPMKNPEKLDVVIFRENTEDVYAGIEWKQGTDDVQKVISFLNKDMGTNIKEDSGIGIKPMSVSGTKRLVKAAIEYAIKNKKKLVTLVHKGNIMKFTEGAFKEWGYEVAKEYSELITESDVFSKYDGKCPPDKIMINDRIADSMFQQLLLRPDEYDVLATPNLNGDYLSDACAAQVGGLGIAPGANINYETGHALFEATHGSAPKYAGLDKVNPTSFILSGVMMLEYIGWKEAAALIVTGLKRSIEQKKVTYDLHRQMDQATLLKCSEFGEAIIENMSNDNVG